MLLKPELDHNALLVLVSSMVVVNQLGYVEAEKNLPIAPELPVSLVNDSRPNFVQEKHIYQDFGQVIELISNIFPKRNFRANRYPNPIPPIPHKLRKIIHDNQRKKRCQNHVDENEHFDEKSEVLFGIVER